MVFAIDIGGTFVKIGLVDNSEIIVKTRIESHPKASFINTISDIENTIIKLLFEYSISINDLQGIGIGFPGIVDSVNMKVLSTNKKYDDSLNFNFIDWAKKTYNTPVFLENDARVALLGEWQYGAGKGIDNITMMTLGTGVGSAAIINGELLKGKHFQAGNLGGHSIVKVNGALCTCGNLGCVEAEASTWRVAEILQSDPRYINSMIKGDKLDFESVFKYAEEGGELSLAVRNQCLEIWSAGIINQIHGFDPELVIIGGGVMKSADVIIPFIKNKVEKHAWTHWGKVNIVPSKIPNKSALLGGYYLVIKNLIK